MRTTIRPPHIIGFGAQKAGTSWLFENLSLNPAVWKPIFKEMHYFTHATMGTTWMLGGHRKKLLGLRDKLRNDGSSPDALDNVEKLLTIRLLSEDWYREAYSRCPEDKVSMDITPAYAILTDEGVSYVKNYVGSDLRTIFIIRDPADRAISAIKKSLAGNEQEVRSLDAWTKHLKHSTVWKRSQYNQTVSRLDRLIGDDNIFLPFGLIKSDPISFLRMIEKHCGLPEGDYKRSAARPRHVSPKVPVPDAVRDTFMHELRFQYDFLAARFDRSFLAQV